MNSNLNIYNDYATVTNDPYLCNMNAIKLKNTIGSNKKGVVFKVIFSNDTYSQYTTLIFISNNIKVECRLDFNEMFDLYLETKIMDNVKFEDYNVYIVYSDNQQKEYVFKDKKFNNYIFGRNEGNAACFPIVKGHCEAIHYIVRHIMVKKLS